jgi:hypothetical protein
MNCSFHDLISLTFETVLKLFEVSFYIFLRNIFGIFFFFLGLLHLLRERWSFDPAKIISSFQLLIRKTCTRGPAGGVRHTT